jgi:NAD(P)-dependent dehydrogenase (short-subunit alcohol dehydrogenase family)
MLNGKEAIDGQADERWDAIIAVNLPSAFHLIKAVLPGMQAHGISGENVIRDVMLAHQARKRCVAADGIAMLAVLLGSDAAASITATALAVDVSWTKH